jgi:catechol 2,3-dioxygenase-like lactoylglutathione lyase family enzyme
MTTPPTLRAIDHVQLAIPRGGEDAARAYWVGVFGLVELPKPPGPAKRGGCWFIATGGHVQVHVGIEDPFAPARSKQRSRQQATPSHGPTTYPAPGASTRTTRSATASNSVEQFATFRRPR